MPVSGAAGAHRAPRRADRRRAAGRAEPRARPSAWWRWSSEAYELAGQPFNLGSPKQIGEILFGKLGLPVKKKTASGAPSHRRRGAGTNWPPTTRCRPSCSSTAASSKLKGTYTDKLPLMVNPATGRVHTNYAQAVAVTGRLSSNDPNLQNIPIRTPEGRRVREAFIAPPGHRDRQRRLLADRAAHHGAHQRRRRACCAPSREGMDVHRATASEVFGVAARAR